MKRGTVVLGLGIFLALYGLLEVFNTINFISHNDAGWPYPFIRAVLWGGIGIWLVFKGRKMRATG